MEIREIFENRIKIEPKVMSIETLFNNPERVNNTNYKPFYQRNYVWDDEKATYFIESILLGTEIPPLIYFRNSDKVEVIDGRQRYQTILRYINGEFKLKKNGLQKLDNIGIENKSWKDLSSSMQDLFWDTKLRIIEFSFHSQNLIDEENEELVKKEIFKRYNSGITPLKPTEIDNAIYFEDDLNAYIKSKLQNDKILFRDISKILHFEKTNNEIILKKIRQLLVQYKIPIKYYSVKKNTVISKFYDFLFSTINEDQIEDTFNALIEKINLLNRIKDRFEIRYTGFNRLIGECLFWAFSVIENEGIKLGALTDTVIDELIEYINKNIAAFEMVRSSFSTELINRYTVTSKFFQQEFDLDFKIYLEYNSEFKMLNNSISSEQDTAISFDELRINKPEPSSIAIMDICRQMGRQRFLIRPPYQRNEVINKKKSSSIIESILLGIKLPPIFVYKRPDEISEVLDGQQRLLSILGFIEESYLDENNKTRYSDKNGFSLNLKNDILKNLHGKKFLQLSSEQRDKIKNFDLWIIEINHKNNKNFEPIDLFIRLNNKPYPIKEDTFEMWNSYISRDIIETLKSIHKNNSSWFYLRKNNSRMEDENIYTALAYFQFNWIRSKYGNDYVPTEIDIYNVVDKINLRVKSKNEITSVLENPDNKIDFIKASNELEFDFIRKLKILLSDESDSSSQVLNKNLDEIFIVENGRRTRQAFYALWYFLYNITQKRIADEKSEIRKGLTDLFRAMTKVKNKEAFDVLVQQFKLKFKDNEYRRSTGKNFVLTATMGEICLFSQGITLPIAQVKTNLFNSASVYPYLKKSEFMYFKVPQDDVLQGELPEGSNLKDFFDSKPKILVKKSVTSLTRFDIAYYDSRIAFSNNFIGITVNRSNFSSKYISSILFSRYCFYHNFRLFNNDFEEIRPISVADLKSILIPSIDFDVQKLFETVFDYIYYSKEFSQSALFFERILDVMVYELYYQEKFTELEIDILKHVKNLEEITLEDDEQRSAIILTNYHIMSSPEHPLSASLLKILNIIEVGEIESFGKI